MINSLPDTPQKTFFLIDDDEDDLELFITALHEVNKPITCLTAKNGVTALKMLEDENLSPDYIFLDLNMPVMNGKEFLSEIKTRHRLRNIPVIILSTSSDYRDKTETLALGASAFITKPASLSRLIKVLGVFF